MSCYKDRLKEIDDILGENVISLERLRKFCYTGVPDEGGRRAVSWMLLLGYLPPERSMWKDTLEHKRSQYEHFIDEMVVEAACISKNANDEKEVLMDHPLNISPESEWCSFFRDNDVLKQIDKDVRRLCPDMMFFQKATEFPCKRVVDDVGIERLHQRVSYSSLSSLSLTRKGIGITKMESSKKRTIIQDYMPLDAGAEAHWEVLQRILFIYAKLNPGQSYVQGMNEIIGPLYYTLTTNSVEEFRSYSEADTFWCFIALMGEIRDFFIHTLDDSSSGIGGMMDRLLANLNHHDHQLWNRLKQKEVRPQFFSFRWLTLLLSQEFDLPDVIRIWDTLFSDSKRFSFLIHVCTAMLVLQREKILCSDFPDIVKLLQNYPPIEIRLILIKATELTEDL